MDVPPGVITTITTNAKYLLHWDKGMQKLDASSISDHLNLLELSFYHAGLNELLTESYVSFKETANTYSAPGLLMHVMNTGRNRYENKIDHDYQRPLINKGSFPADIWQSLLANNPYSEASLYRRLDVNWQAVNKQREAIKEQLTTSNPYGDEDIPVPTERKFQKYRVQFANSDYKSAITSVAQSISEKLQHYPAPRYTNAQMTDKILTDKQETSGRRFAYHPRGQGNKHPGLRHFYTPTAPDPEQKELELNDTKKTPASDYTSLFTQAIDPDDYEQPEKASTAPAIQPSLFDDTP